MEYLNPKSVKQIIVSNTQPIEPIHQIKPIISTNKTSLNYINPKLDDSRDLSDHSKDASVKKNCAESEKNINIKVLKDDFMSVKIGGNGINMTNKKLQNLHKKGNKSMNLRGQKIPGNQIVGMKMMDDFDLQTLDLGDSEIKT